MRVGRAVEPMLSFCQLKEGHTEVREGYTAVRKHPLVLLVGSILTRYVILDYTAFVSCINRQVKQANPYKQPLSLSSPGAVLSPQRSAIHHG